MTRDQIIAHLILHGYVPYANKFDWLAIWNGEQGRLIKYFHEGQDGPGWDVRRVISGLALSVNEYCEVPWHRFSDEALAVLIAPLPSKFKHRNPMQQRGYVLPKWESEA